MKKAALLFLILIHSFSFYAQPVKQLNKDSLIVDFNILRQAITNNHPIGFTYISKAKFDSLSDFLEQAIKKEPTLTEFYLAVSRLLSSVGCGHTFAYVPNVFKEHLKLINDLPFEVSLYDTSIYITKVYLKQYEKFLGSSISEINNISSRKLLKASYQILSADGLNTTFKQHSFEDNFNNYINIFLNNPDSILVNTSVGILKINFPTHFIKKEPETNTEYHELKNVPNTVLLTIPDFDGGKHMIKHCFAFMRKHKTENLIIDLRDNDGGNGNIASCLFSYLIDSVLEYHLDKKITPFAHKEYLKNKRGFVLSNQYTMTDSVTKSYYFKVKPRNGETYRGNLFVLINGETFSSAAYAASVIKHKTKSTFIGEETGGSEYAIGGGVIGRLVLPYSGLSIKFPLYKWRFNATTINAGHGTMPDVSIMYKPEDIISNKDLELDKAIELIGHGK